MSFDLASAARQLSGENLEQLSRLDRHGLLIGPGETLDAYRDRLILNADAIREMEERLEAEGELEVDAGVRVTPADRVPPALLVKSAELTRKLYSFRLDWAPGFFVREGVGMLWGGCAWYDPETHRTVFLLRDSFRQRENYWVYSRRELIAHELCHVARNAFEGEWQLEELYAYRTSASPLRRYLGNCFVKRFDALLFLGPALIILMAQIINVFLVTLPWWPVTWALLVVCVGYLLLRNHLARRRFFKVRKKLRKWMPRHAQALMFRATWKELGEIHRLRKRRDFEQWLAGKEQQELRWRIIAHRFVKSTSNEELTGPHEE